MTKNADLPAMPLTGDAYTDFSSHLNKGHGFEPECLGLTKREMFAMSMNCDDVKFTNQQVMERFIGKDINPNSFESMIEAQAIANAKIRVMYADALLAELERA